MRDWKLLIGTALLASTALTAGANAAQKNVIVFVTDGLRSAIISEKTAPNLNAIKRDGVYFANSHSIFPTFTTANASAIATGHYLGDTGDFSNTIFSAFATEHAGKSVTPFLENDGVLGDMNAKFNGNYLNEKSLLAAAREAGYQTAAIGKLGPVAIFDVTERTGEKTIVVDDSTGSPGGLPLGESVKAAMAAAGVPTTATPRGENGKSGNATTPGTLVANVPQQQYFADVATKVVLHKFAAANQPFVMIYWSRDPDGSQHNQGDSLNQLVPGINGPTSMAAIANVDNNLGQIRAALKQLNLDASTDIIVTADHGFSTISKQSKTSFAATRKYPDTVEGFLPAGFLAIDIANELGLPLFDPDKDNKAVNAAAGEHSANGDGLIGNDPNNPDVVVAANGGSDLIYLPSAKRAEIAPKLAAFLLKQDYTGGLFADDSLGTIPGALPFSAVNLHGSAATPTPAFAVNFSSTSTGCADPTLCSVEVADTGLRQGQGMHGGYHRADTFNFTAAMGPSFKAGFVDPAPVSNADVGQTAAALIGVQIGGNGDLAGRVMTEAMVGGADVTVAAKTTKSTPADGGVVTIVHQQLVNKIPYLTTAGIPGRVVGLGE